MKFVRYENGLSNDPRNPGTPSPGWRPGCDPVELFEAGRHRDAAGRMVMPEPIRRLVFATFVQVEWLEQIYRLEYGFDSYTGRDLRVETDEMGRVLPPLPLESISVVQLEACPHCGLKSGLHPLDKRRKLRYRVLCNGKRVLKEAEAISKNCLTVN